MRVSWDAAARLSLRRQCRLRVCSARTIKGLLLLTTLPALAACDRATAGEEPRFRVEASVIPEVPTNVVLRVSNEGGDYLCVPMSDAELGGGAVKVLPGDASDFGENRPPAEMLKGMDVGSGLYVVPPGKSLDVFLDIADLAALGLPR